MINASELRIGNYISSNGKVINVGHIQDNFYGVLVNGNGLDTEIYQPIPLTEEWLLKCGFRKSNEKLYFLPIPLLSMEIHSVLFRNEWLIELCNDRKNIVTEATKIHQVQNLYFALTGEELEVKNES